MTLKWHIWHVIDSWSLTAPIRHCSWANGVLQKTSGRRHLYSPSPAALLILDRRPPPLVQISFSPKPSAAIKIKIRKYWALARQNYACSALNPLLKDQSVSCWLFAIIIFDQFDSVKRSLTQTNATKTSHLSTLNTGVRVDNSGVKLY